MGWLFMSGYSRNDVIRERTKSWSNERLTSVCLKHALRGNVLWAVWEHQFKDGSTDRFIACDLLQRQKEYGWGYKDLEESMHPSYYTCPLSFLDLAPPTCEEWRQGVRAYHAKMHQVPDLKVGDRVTLKNCNIPEVTITSLRPLYGRYAGRLYHLNRRVLADVLPEPAIAAAG